MNERLRILWDAWRAPKKGSAFLAARQRARLAEQIAFARQHSPHYADLYRALPVNVDDVTMLPITNKNDLMTHFDAWCTDRRVTESLVRAFVSDPALIGERLLGTYTVATTSGTTGQQGIFLIDDRSMAVTNALALRMLRAWLSAGEVLKIMVRGPRLAMINAMGGHFASAVAATRFQSSRVRVFPIDLPLDHMVEKLNAFRPTVVASYASLASLLASEQEGGNLSIEPALVVLSAEGLPDSERSRIAGAFRAKVRDSYASTECPFISYRCSNGWLHVNSDWVILEPVDSDHEPVPPGVQSHTVLVTNLANRVQPILRYDLGDSVIQKPDACSCRSTLPAIRVQGRTADLLRFEKESGHTVAVPPLLFETLIDHIPEVEQYQIVQTAADILRVRLKVAADADRGDVWKTAEGELRHLLSQRGLSDVALEMAEESPQPGPGGKYRRVVPLTH